MINDKRIRRLWYQQQKVKRLLLAYGEIAERVKTWKLKENLLLYSGHQEAQPMSAQKCAYKHGLPKNTGRCLPQYIDDTSSSLFNQMDIPYEFGNDGDVFSK